MRYVIGVIIGAVIGYITNWLAIKMLFRPRREKRIFGVKLPFTPGLIPKEKERIAKSVSESVGEHLLNKESISKALKAPDVKNKVRVGLEKKVDEFIFSKGTVGHKINSILGEKAEEIIFLNEKKINNKVNSLIKETVENGTAGEFILKELKSKLLEEPTLIKEKIQGINSEKLIVKINSKMNKDKIYPIVENIIKNKIGDLEEENKKLGDIIPIELYDGIESYIINHKAEICREICNALRKENISSKLKEKLEETVFSGLKGFMSMFLSVDTIYEKLVSAIESYLNRDENQKIICTYIVNYIRNTSNINFEDVVSNMPSQLISNLAINITEEGSNIVLDERNIEGLKTFIYDYIDNFESYHSLILFFDGDYEEKLKALINKSLKEIINEESTSKAIETIVSYGKKEILSYDFSSDVESNEELKNIIYELLDKNYDKIVDREIPQILSIVDISKIVEDQINSFEVEYAEELIVGIANKELGAITWLGALLGGILGILSPIIGSIKF